MFVNTGFKTFMPSILFKPSASNLARAHKESRVLGILALYWTNGDRDLLEISKLVELETNQRDLEYLIEYIKLLEKMSVIELKTDNPN